MPVKITSTIFLLFFLQSFSSIAQVGEKDFGARSKALGNANSSLTDEWSIFNNVGGISGVDRGSAIFGYESVIALEGFDRISAGVIQPFKFGVGGLSVYRFGDELYNESLLSVYTIIQLSIQRL